MTNYGTLRNFALDRITVNGGENVGAFCGMNAGTLENLTTADSDAKKIRVPSRVKARSEESQADSPMTGKSRFITKVW